MKAQVMADFGAPDVLELREVRRPDPAPGQARVRVEAVIVSNTRDVRTRSGRHAFSRLITPPHVLGGEHAGTIDAVGEAVDRALLGRRVAVIASVPCGQCEACLGGRDQTCAASELIGVHRQGAYAEYVVAPAENILPLPDDVSASDAVVLLANGPIAYAQIDAAAIGQGDVLVLPGITGSLGSMVAALAKRSGVRVIGVSRDAARAHEMPLACDVIVDATTDLQERLSEACGGLGAHAVIDNVCVSPTWDACISVLRAGGRVVISGSLGSATVCFAPGPFYVAGQSIIGVRTASRSNIREFWSEIKAGLRPELGRVEVFPLTSAPEVHHLVETGQKMGHYVLSPNGLGSSQ